MFKALRYSSALVLCISTSLWGRDLLVEFKTAVFVPTHKQVRDIYGRVSAQFGPEITFQLRECNNWYGFASIDFVTKSGRSVGLCDRTTMRIIPFGLGVKYFVPHCYGDFYVGFGLQPVHLKTVNCSQPVQRTSKWGIGGIAKIGSYFDLPCDFFVDLFFDYSIARIKCDRCLTGVIPVEVKLDGALLGLGLGYRFN